MAVALDSAEVVTNVSRYSLEDGEIVALTGQVPDERESVELGAAHYEYIHERYYTERGAQSGAMVATAVVTIDGT